MAWFEREFIAVPDDKKDQVVFKWPDVNLRKGSRAIVEADQMAVFMNKGEVIGTLGPGQHRIDADEIIGLGALIDKVTGGNAYRAELFFCGTREYAGEPFGGRIDNVQDPQTGNIVTLRVFGEYSYKVIDPTKLILNLVGTIDVENNDAITDWVEQQMLKVMRTEVTRQIVRNGWPILGLSAFTPEIEQAVIDATNVAVDSYVMFVARLGNFDINLTDEDEATLKKLAKDTAYSRLAGGFNQYAAGEALLGAGEGMAKGGGGTQAAFIGMGMGIGQQMTQPPQQGPVPPPAPGFAGGGGGYAQAPTGGPVCPTCQAQNTPGARFCSSCGGAMAPAKKFCTECGGEIEAEAKFCANCGAQQGVAAKAAATPEAPAPQTPVQQAPSTQSDVPQNDTAQPGSPMGDQPPAEPEA